MLEPKDFDTQLLMDMEIEDFEETAYQDIPVEQTIDGIINNIFRED